MATYGLTLIEGNGWVLATDNPQRACTCCGKILVVPFYFVQEAKTSYCVDCVVGVANTAITQLHLDKEYFKIILVQKIEP